MRVRGAALEGRDAISFTLEEYVFSQPPNGRFLPLRLAVSSYWIWSSSGRTLAELITNQVVGRSLHSYNSYNRSHPFRLSHAMFVQVCA